MAGLTFYIVFTDSPSLTSSVPQILGIVQFFIAVVAALLFGIMPSGRLFDHYRVLPQAPFGTTDEKSPSKMEDLPFYCIGFKSAVPEFTLRTCIRASLQAQTLYRTVSGMINYFKATKLLY
ncbi:hypothetical protein BD410DRAFT_845595 [Rickenella mellea]|uniref:Uncharacterized protein n=1 Tax=Rickenella mellea TaxID=50990 RepID=A0A4Y7PIP6_9AGAM|nr:hypothetical protein BD410DRAFT_845595 [Rickenella mellea]